MTYGDLVEENKRLSEENRRLRKIFPKILQNLENGSCCNEECSIEFLENIPCEVTMSIHNYQYELNKYSPEIVKELTKYSILK